MTMASPAVMDEADEEFHLASDDVAPNTLSPPPPREEFSTPLPPDVMEELAQITTKLLKCKEKKNPEIEDTLHLFIQEWRSQTHQEIEDLKKLKERVSIRKAQRREEEARWAEMRAQEEELLRQMAEEDRIRKQEEKIKRLQEAELKRQKMMEEQNKGRNFTIQSTGREQTTEQANISREPTKEEYDAMKEAALSVIIKPLEIGGLRKERLKRKGAELWDKIVKLETERYDLEEKRTRQEYDFKELKERQKQQLRQKALKLGLEPEALTGKYPPKIRVASKYERRKGLKPFGETKGLFEGGFIKEYNQRVDEDWHKRQDIFTKRNPDELPPWLADMPRQILKQIEEEEAAIKAVISKEEVEGKQPPGEEGEDANENENENEEEEVQEKNEEEKEEGEEEAAEEEEGGEEDKIEKKEIVVEKSQPEVEEEEEEEVEEEEEEVEEAAPQKPSPAKQQEEELEADEEEEEEEIDVVPKAAPAPEEEEEAEEEELEEVEEVEEEEEEEDDEV